MEMVKTALVALAMAAGSSGYGTDFSLAIGNPSAVALPDGVFKKDAVLAVRGENCADLSKVQISGVAEGIVNGARQSIPLRLIPATTPGTFALSRDWPRGGTWVVSLTGHCGSSTASAVVPFGPNGFLRDSSKFFPRAATTAEIEAVLRTLHGGAQ